MPVSWWSKGAVRSQQFASTFASSVRCPRHVASSLLIEGNDGQAVLRAYVQMYALAGDPPHQAISASGTYADTLVRLEDGWRFVRRTFTSDS